METEKVKVVEKVTSVTAIGAGAGMALASLFSAPLLIPALIGGGVACLGSAVIEAVKEKK